VLWNLATNSLDKILEGHENGVLDITFSPHGRYLASGSDDKTAKIWDLIAGVELMSWI